MALKNRNIKVAFILNSTLPLCGASKAFKTLAHGLKARGVSLVAVLPDNNGLYNELEKMGIQTFVTTFRPHTFPYLRSPKDYVLFLPRLIARAVVNRIAAIKVTKWLRSQNINIIHTNVSIANIGYIAAKKLHVPHIYHIREYGDLDFNMHYFPSKKSFYSQLKTKDSYSICITKGIQTYHKQNNETTSRVIYDGICHKKNKMPEHQDKRFFLFAGRIEPAKGLDFIIDAYSIYIKNTENALPLYVTGSMIRQDYNALIRQKIEEYSIGQYIHFAGERSDIEQLMQKATAIIIASPFEGFGLCMAEAMFNGCLAIGRNTGGTKEQMDNGYTLTKKEIALRFETPQELAVHLRTVTKMGKKETEVYTKNAFNTVNSTYTEENTADNVLDFYNKILE